MAQREREKTKRAPARPTSVAGLSDAVQRLEARAKTLERERDGLRAELDAARERIATLEASRAEVANRIDWVLDSLNGLANRPSL